jgi:hypothetical protein
MLQSEVPSLAEVLWLAEIAWLVGLVGSDFLSGKYCFPAVGAAKAQNEQGRYQTETLDFLECPKDTIQVC